MFYEVVMVECLVCMLWAYVDVGVGAVPEEHLEEPEGQEAADAENNYASEGKFHRTWFWSYCTYVRLSVEP